MRMELMIEKEEVYSPQKRQMVKKAKYLTLEIICQDEKEMDVVRDLFEKELLERKDDFESPFEKGFASCYCGEEANWDSLSIPYDKNTVKNDREVFQEIWKSVKKDYKSA